MIVDEKPVSNAQLLNEDNEFWIFGYGSLIWKPPPSFDRRIPGYIKGYVRRFWQASEDHRGTPANPGRVVTLIERGVWDTLTDHHLVDDVVWGVVYRIKSSEVESVKEYLDIREINGYSIDQVEVWPADQQVQTTIRAIVYIGTPSNPQFVGNPPPDVNELARHIYHSRGPSGENRDYLFQLHKSLVELCPNNNDNHVYDLQQRVALIEQLEKKSGHEQLIYDENLQIAEGQEEVEKMCHSDLR